MSLDGLVAEGWKDGISGEEAKKDHDNSFSTHTLYHVGYASGFYFFPARHPIKAYNYFKKMISEDISDFYRSFRHI